MNSKVKMMRVLRVNTLSDMDNQMISRKRKKMVRNPSSLIPSLSRLMDFQIHL